MQCPLCGYEFDETGMSCHSSCAFNQQCAVICCPNCGYQVADASKSRLVAAFRSMVARFTAVVPPPSGTCRLSALQPGQSARVVALDTVRQSRLERLQVFGLVPGCQVTLEQRQPTFVLRVGFTELSIERDIADEIVVDTVP